VTALIADRRCAGGPVLALLLAIGALLAMPTAVSAGDPVDACPTETDTHATPRTENEPQRTPVTSPFVLGMPVPQPLAVPARATVRFRGAARDVFVYPSTAPTPSSQALRLVFVDAAGGAVLAAASGAADPLREVSTASTPLFLFEREGIAYRAYLVDAAGGVWRVDLQSGLDSVQLTRLADLRSLAGPGERLSFPVPPDLYRGRDDAGRAYDGLVLAAAVDGAAGRRIDLLLLRDYPRAGGAVSAAITFSDLVALDSCATDAPDSTATCNASRGPGWYLRAVAPGDALSSAPLIDGGRVFLTTHSALTRDCNGESARRFAVVVDLPSGRSELGEDRYLTLGRQPLDGPEVSDGRIVVPGLAEALGDEALSESMLQARGARGRLVYWLDLLLDADN
jgi:hypothetical protein